MSEQAPLLKDQPSAAPTAPPPAYQATAPGPVPPPQPAPPATTVVLTQQPIVVATSFSDVPVQLRCPNCHRDVLTNLSYTTGVLTWLVVGLMLLLGFWLGCCLIPLCIDGLKDVNHTCPNCGHLVGTYKRV